MGHLEDVASKIHAVTLSLVTVALPTPVHEALMAVPSDPINATDHSFRVSSVLLASVLVTRLRTVTCSQSRFLWTAIKIGFWMLRSLPSKRNELPTGRIPLANPLAPPDR